MLAYSLLVHCLCRRHRVDYGMDERRGKSRRVAVPYRASDTPSERAEYAQPDSLILLTQLSYYHDGLKKDEIREALRALLSLGPIAQGEEYALWLRSAHPSLTAEQLGVLDDVRKLDLSNELQLTLLHSVYAHNMAAVDFWLATCVLPRESMQFSQRLVSTAFHLADNAQKRVVGFSGTKDNALLLPFPVSQQQPNCQELAGTDGKMLDLVGLRSQRVVCLDGSPLSEAVLQLAVVEAEAAALIDAGATMAGLSNEQVAQRVLNLLPTSSRFQGVAYFSTAANAWTVASRHGRSWPLGSSPIREKDAFVFFDESRCRGADLKLHPEATALLTIGTGMRKDKLMQAAGRMRKLMYGQKLVLAVPAELVAKIRANNRVAAEELTPLHVLTWTIHTTVEAITAGLPEWGGQGSHFTTTRDPSTRLLEENLRAEDLYAGPVAEETAEAVVLKRQERDQARIAKLGVRLDTAGEARKVSIGSHARKYGSDVTLVCSGLDEECERELETERELEREVERQFPRQAPKEPQQWDFSAVLHAVGPTDLPANAGVLPLAEAIRAHLPSLAAINWGLCGISATRNFMLAVTGREGQALADHSEHSRPVGSVLLFNSGECLLLSEWETDQLLGLQWAHAPGGPCLVDLAYLRHAADEGWVAQPHLLVGTPLTLPGTNNPRPHLFFTRPSRPEPVAPLLLAGLQLLAGETVFGTESRKQAVRELLSSPEARQAALHLPAMRGLQHMVSRSDLEAICAADIGEA